MDRATRGKLSLIMRTAAGDENISIGRVGWECGGAEGGVRGWEGGRVVVVFGGMRRRRESDHDHTGSGGEAQ